MFKLYNGCPNSELQAHLDRIDKADKFIRHNGYLITYFPMEGVYYLCEKETYKSIGNAFQSQGEAAAWLETIINKKEV